MFYEIQPGHHINLKDITYFYLPESEMYRNSIIIYFRGMKSYQAFRYQDHYSCQRAYEKLVAKIYAMDKPIAIMD